MSPRKPVFLCCSISLSILVTFSTPSLFGQEAELYFTSKKEFKVSKLKTQTVFHPGDTIYGVIYVNPRYNAIDDRRLVDYTYTRENGKIVPVAVHDMNGNTKIEWNADFLSGLSPKKKSGFMKALEDATSDGAKDVSDGQQLFFFRVLPVSSSELDTDWMRWFKSLVQSSNSKKEIEVTAGTYGAVSVQKSFYLDMSNGTGPYSSWIQPLLNQERNAQNQKELEKKKEMDALNARLRKEHEKDSISKWAAHEPELKESDQVPLPIAKLKKPKVEKAILSYLGNEYRGDKFYKVYIYSEDGYGKSFEYTVKVLYKNAASGFCYVATAKVQLENPLPDEYYPKDNNFYNSTMIRCGRIPN